MGDPSLHKSENRTILDPSGRVRLGLSFTTAGSCSNAWPIREVEKTRSDTRPHGLPVGGGTGVAAHPVAQLTEQVIPTCSLTQHPHRSHPPRTHTFHTIYDAAGKLVAEYSTVIAPQQDAKVAYLTNDHLGSPRMNTDQRPVSGAGRAAYPKGWRARTATPSTGGCRRVRNGSRARPTRRREQPDNERP